ncbi:MAG: tRNA preQ1(34) S-adenosylmethionine ribosyltransferase-isomerase QueA [Lachnospiraceae bacterium]|nr:tRNA preQ1(34) S-adenosylmethionine ribosyltransferase-isomerase QueA [Lachnospiraceae bacterium]
MKTSDFYYELPEELIAQDPLTDRSASRLLHLDRRTGEVTHDSFKNICSYLREGDTLVINDTKVIPARLLGTKSGTGAKIEILLLKRLSDHEWETLVKPGKKCRPGTFVNFGEPVNEEDVNGEPEDGKFVDGEPEDGKPVDGEPLNCTGSKYPLVAEILEIMEEGNRRVRFHYDGIFEEVLLKLGEMPLPPYIHKKLQDKDRYNTVYAKYDGSAAAPTAGLHFTKELLQEVQKKGVRIARVTLHVGLGTFRPVKVEDVTKHHMHTEQYVVTEEAAKLINDTKAAGGRVICVGTTSCRTVESAADENGVVQPGTGWTDIFIYPGYRFKIMDGLITNFHLPESTLVMLVSAFAGREQVLSAYEEAVRERYRFFSFGDAMVIE